MPLRTVQRKFSDARRWLFEKLEPGLCQDLPTTGHETDELVMSLVESALDRPPEQREEYLRLVCHDDALREDVRIRLCWEERMGRFLLDPLMRRAATRGPGQRRNSACGSLSRHP